MAVKDKSVVVSLGLQYEDGSVLEMQITVDKVEHEAAGGEHAELRV